MVVICLFFKDVIDSKLTFFLWTKHGGWSGGWSGLRKLGLVGAVGRRLHLGHGGGFISYQ